MFKFNLKKLSLLAIVGCLLTVNNTYSKIIISQCSLRNIASTFWIKPSLSPEYDLVETRLSNQELFILNNNYDLIFKPQIQTAIDLTDDSLNKDFPCFAYRDLNITANGVVIIKDILRTFLYQKLLSESKNDAVLYYKCMAYAKIQFKYRENVKNTENKLTKYSSTNPKLYEIARFVFFDLEFSPECGFFVDKKTTCNSLKI